ncbi:MAG: enoyl-CoA hydratase-related protein, partial [Acidimicrobiaceae bacterium]|nr:enoyl-CoA hydratase-related protein [Acidimicrobiaceae bacterium]
PQRHRVEHMRDIADTVMAIHDCPRPVIAKVDGVAVGAGFGIALAADLAWCSSRARFSLIFAKRGLSLDFGTSWLLPKRVGLHEAKRLALTGEIIDAARAVELGIVNGVVEVGELDAQVAETAARIAAGPPIALASSKRLLNNAAGVSLFQALEAEGLSQAVNFSTSDTAEAMSAFVDKRDPVFKGR